MIVTEEGAVVGSVDRAQLAELEDSGDVPVAEDLSAFTKAELVERAEAEGVKTSGMNKAELVAALESLEPVVEPEG